MNGKAGYKLQFICLLSVCKTHLYIYIVILRYCYDYSKFFIFSAIRTHSPNKPVLIFVSSRRQTRLTALDLIAYLAAEMDPKQWLHMEERPVKID